MYPTRTYLYLKNGATIIATDRERLYLSPDIARTHA
jgi:hypothetical protein